MSDATLERLRTIIRRKPPTRLELETIRREDVRRGDFVRVDPPDGSPRLFLFLDSDRAVLTSPETWAAAREDIVTYPTDTGLPFRLLIETDLRAFRLRDGLAYRRVGTMDPADELLSVVEASAEEGIPPQSHHCGLEIRGPSDWRYQWKLEELDELRRFSDPTFGAELA